MTFNREKCQFGVTELEFYGYKFTKDGLKPTPEKVQAVKECKAPETKEAVRSFLGMIGYLSKFIPSYAVLTAPLRKLTQKQVPFAWGQEQQEAFQQLKDSITDEKTIAFFDPRRPIIVRVEASFHEGLSAGLFQKTGKGLQPVHFISRSMTETEQRYSQTEKDALAVKWAKGRFSMYLLGAPRFKIITSHKPLIPMFNKTSGKLPPRIEKWVMDMQDVDYELVYEPGKDEADPLDYLSRHPLPTTETDDTEQIIKQIVETEHAIVLPKIADRTTKDEILKDVVQRIQKNDWEKNKKRPEILPYYRIKEELSVAGGLLLRGQQIIVPDKLQKQVVKAAHSMGHLGRTKTKQMLRAKYWFPAMNAMVEDIVGGCLDCQITTKDHRKETVKPTEIPEEPWDTVSIDFGGPFPDGHYNLVVIDKRTRYPEVEKVTTTSCRVTAERLRKIFSTHGIPRRVESDSGPPFNSEQFGEFAKEMGFVHHRVTPEHPRANGEAESFMKLLNKTEQIAHRQGRRSQDAIQEMLMGYRSTPHPATGISPYNALMRRKVRTKLDQTATKIDVIEMEQNITKADNLYKSKWAENKRHAKDSHHKITVGDTVFLKQHKRNKWTTAYEGEPYTVTRVDGSSIAARRSSDGRKIYRDATHFKVARQYTTTQRSDNWRERLFQRARAGDTRSQPSRRGQNQRDVHEGGSRRDTAEMSRETMQRRQMAKQANTCQIQRLKTFAIKCSN